MISSELVSTQQQLDEFCSHAANHNLFAIDTEFMRDKTFFPIPCVLQIATTEKVAIIDLLTNLNLNKLEKLLFAPDVSIILHAFQQDLEILALIFKNPTIGNYFDTQIANMFIKRTQPLSYSDLVKEICNKQVCKSLQYSNWQERPLSDKQIDYCISDVIYLFELHEYLHNKLVELNKLTFFQEEINLQKIDKLDVEKKTNLSKFYKHINSVKSLFIAETLCNKQLELAIKYNKPKNIILPNYLIIKLLNSLKDPDFSDEIVEKISKDFLVEFEESTYDAKYAKMRKRIREMQKVDKNLIKLLQNALSEYAENNQITDQLIASKKDLVKLVLTPEKSNILHGWRQEIYGGAAKQIIDSF